MRATMSKIVCGGLGALAVLAVLCTTDLAHADGTMSALPALRSHRRRLCRGRAIRPVRRHPFPNAAFSAARARNNNDHGNRGRQTIMTIADPAGGVPATIECFCIAQLGSGGYCFPMQIGNSVTCQGSPGSGCACMMGLIIPDAPG